MASTTAPIRLSRLNIDIGLSPREMRLAEQMIALGENWCNSKDLCAVEFGAKKNGWPLNASKLVTGAVTSIQRKLDFHGSRLVLIKRGEGGRGGIEYRIEKRKRNK